MKYNRMETGKEGYEKPSAESNSKCNITKYF